MPIRHAARPAALLAAFQFLASAETVAERNARQATDAFARSNSQLNVIRYADDFAVTGVSKEVLESKVLPAVKQFMAARGLELSDEKTRITHISEGFNFLGQNVRKYTG